MRRWLLEGALSVVWRAERALREALEPPPQEARMQALEARTKARIDALEYSLNGTMDRVSALREAARLEGLAHSIPGDPSAPPPAAWEAAIRAWRRAGE